MVPKTNTRIIRKFKVIAIVPLLLQLTTHSQVIVMIYCQGGSLYNLLEQPQYGFGFPDDEFLTFLDHIGRLPGCD